MQRIVSVPLIVAMAVAMAVVTSCTSSRTPDQLEGTRAVGLPPLPPDLTPKVYVVDVFIASGCAQVPSGLRNCQEILRREAARKLLQRLEQEVSAQFEDRVVSQVGGDGGSFKEDATFLSQVTSSFAGHLSLRDHESPIFRLEEPDSYALRVALVREELDYLLWSEISERAKSEGRKNVATAFSAITAERYDDEAPDSGRIRAVEEDIARHFVDMWKQAGSRNGEG